MVIGPTKWQIYKNIPLVTLILLNAIVRIPGTLLSPKYVTGDTTILVWMAESIITHGKAMWFLHPASATGLVDYSYPVFVPMLLASTSIIADLTRADLVYKVSIFYIILAIVSGYCLGYTYSRDHIIALLTALALSLNSEFVGYTTGSGSSSGRIILIIFLSIITYLIMKFETNKDLRVILVIGIFAAGTVLAHRMSMILIGVFLAYLITKVVMYINVKFDKRNSAVFKKYFKYAYASLFVIGYMFTFTPLYPLSNHLQYLEKGLLISGKSPFALTLNAFVDYAALINPIIVLFGLLGILIVLKSEKFNFPNMLLLIELLVFIPIITFSDYATHVVIPIIAVFFGHAIHEILIERRINNNLKRLFLSLIFILLIAALLFYVTPAKSVVFYHQPFIKENPHVEVTAEFIRGLDGNVTTDSSFTARNYMLYSEKPVFPLMGPEFPTYYPDMFNNMKFYFNLIGYIKWNQNFLWRQEKDPKIGPDPIGKIYLIQYKINSLASKNLIYNNNYEIISD